MTRVCLIGNPDCTLQYELLSRETSREALATYDLTRPFDNALAMRTVSIGAAVSLLNDLQWYLTRFVDEALIKDPSVSTDEWLSRPLAEALRNGTLEPADTGEYCKIYGLERESNALSADDAPTTEETTQPDETASSPGRPRLVEPLYVRRTNGELPTYDLRDVEETLIVRLTEDEYSP
ncbi:DUF5804 family protein [Natronolimnobius baerhuensis]|uniref:Uncharacterized protein n=1 Tax=Natronolimnobius baerhuensis TaxID=253108 RepID=A0A202ECR5_9EURY|nr:DUF5804 family protein [Natronolimnobius baerhuensis]OVE86019.1 hypothetical protein B2G88_04280 [Natronolimnobius baerhuensis]